MKYLEDVTCALRVLQDQVASALRAVEDAVDEAEETHQDDVDDGLEPEFDPDKVEAAALRALEGLTTEIAGMTGALDDLNEAL